MRVCTWSIDTCRSKEEKSCFECANLLWQSTIVLLAVFTGAGESLRDRSYTLSEDKIETDRGERREKMRALH